MESYINLSDLKYKSTLAQETYNLGKEITKQLKVGDVVLFYGDLGAGKTEIIKGICAGLGYKGRVLSPTFQLVREYGIKSRSNSNSKPTSSSKSKSISKIYHIDLYRLEGGADLESLGLEDYFEDKKAVTLIEWADRLRNEDLPKKHKEVKIEIVSEEERMIYFNQ